MKLINNRAHDVVDRACENLTRWPNDFISREDLVMLIHAEIEAAVNEALKEVYTKSARQLYRFGEKKNDD